MSRGKARSASAFSWSMLSGVQPFGSDERTGELGRGKGREDFAGLRHHQPADAPRHVAWKTVARGGPWRTKEFDGAGARAVALDWQQLPVGMGTEERLSRLTR